MLEVNKKYPNETIFVRTPVGNITVIVVEDNGKPIHLFIHGGKNGTELAAYCDMTSRLGSELLTLPNGIDRLMEHLSGITSDRSVKDHATGIECRSGAEGIYNALTKYKNHKYKTLMQTFGDYRPAKLNRMS